MPSSSLNTSHTVPCGIIPDCTLISHPQREPVKKNEGLRGTGPNAEQLQVILELGGDRATDRASGAEPTHCTTQSTQSDRVHTGYNMGTRASRASGSRLPAGEESGWRRGPVLRA